MLDMLDYTIATFENEDIEYRLEADYQPILDYLRENDLMDDVVLEAVDWLRAWYDDVAGDAVYDALWDSLKRVLGKEKLRELQDID